MDLILVTITGIALLLAVAMGFVVFTVLGDERRRSDARVELLKRATTAAVEPPAPAATPWRGDADVDVDVDSPVGAVTERGLFATTSEASPWTARLGPAAAIGIGVALAGYLLLPGDAGRAGTTPATVQAAPIELVALSHTQRPGALTISGMVQNPGTGSPALQLSAVAFLFGPDGTLLATGRTAIDYPRLGPGEESPFVIDVPISGTVARYRVGFRRADGSVLAHVDRRVDSSSARRERAAGDMPWDR